MALPIPSMHAKIDEVLQRRASPHCAGSQPEVTSPLDQLSDLPALHRATT
jgi:hypothetical protein